MAKLAAAVIICAIALPAAGETNGDRETPRRAAWEWKLEERLAERFDPVKIRERQGAYREKHREQLQASGVPAAPERDYPGQRVVRYTIDGARNPELFLPHELFDSLLSAFTTDPEVRMKQRQFLMDAGLRAAGLDDTFWDEIESLASAYLLVRFASSGGVSPTRQEKCRLRYDALQAAREAFGRDRFDKLLYSVVAPNFSRSAITVGVDPVAELRQAEEGCR